MVRQNINNFLYQSSTVTRVWQCIVLDEVHLIRNPHSATTKSIFQLKSLSRIAASGTPIQNQVYLVHEALISNLKDNYFIDVLAARSLEFDEFYITRIFR
jgi:hypothetical protein